MTRNRGKLLLLDHFFHISERSGSLRKELLGGFTTFLAMAYIIFVNPAILSLSGMDKGALITVTCISAALGSVLMGLFGNVPIALAPGMGLNAFFTFSLVQGSNIPWPQVLGIVFISGIVFLILTISGLRKHIAKAIPPVIIISSTAGIGLFIALIGMKNMNLIIPDANTLVAMGSFNMSVILGIMTLIVMMILEIRKVPGSLLIGIFFGTVMGLVTGETTLPQTLFSLPPSMAPIAFKLDIPGALKWSFFPAIFSFMFLDFFDSLATLLACNKEIGTQNKNGEGTSLGRMLYYDAIASIFGALLGTSTVTAFIESGTGIAAGARTGLAAIVTGIFFLLALLFTPLVAMVPAFAVAPALIMVGVLMFRSLALLDFKDPKTSIVAFLTTVMMPFTYSISNGLTFGFLSYILLNVVTADFKKIHPVLWVIGALCVLNIILR